MPKLSGWGFGDVFITGSSGNWSVEKTATVVRKKGTGGNKVHYRVFNDSNVAVQLRFDAASWDPESPFTSGNAPTALIKVGEMKPLRRVVKGNAKVNTMHKFRFEIKPQAGSWVPVTGDPWVFVY